MLIDMSGGMRLQAAARMAASAAAALAQQAADQSPSWASDMSDQAGIFSEAKQPRVGKKARQRQRKQVAAG